MASGFLFSYSDIVFATEHARRVAAAPAPVALVVDRRWRDAYDGPHAPPGERGRAGARRRHGRRRRASRASASALVAGRGGRRRVHRPGALLARGRGGAARASGARRSRAGCERRSAPPRRCARRICRDGLNALADARRGAGAGASSTARWREIDTEEDLARADAGRRRLADDVTCPGPIPAHWLHRLDRRRVAGGRRDRARPLRETALARRAVRPGVTHARRAAGMAWNAVLVTAARRTASAAATWSTSSRSRRRPTATRRSRPPSAPPPACCATRPRRRPR